MTPSSPHPAAAELPATGTAYSADPPPPANWLEAVLNLVTSRVALVELEAKAAARGMVKRLVLCVALAACLVFAWALVVVGTIAAVATATGMAWYWLALTAAALHLFVGLVLAKLAKAPATPSFPVTRAEFHKDRAWIHNL